MANILLADDESAFRDLLDLVLSAQGHRYKAVASGEEALAVLEERPVDLLLCDLVMGGMSGIETMQRARDLQPDLKIVAVSGTQPSLRQAGNHLPLGAHALVMKPFKIEQLTEAIDGLLAAH